MKMNDVLLFLLFLLYGGGGFVLGYAACRWEIYHR